MSRPVVGNEVLDDALIAIAAAKTIEHLLKTQAVAMPLQYHLSLAQTAQAIGISPGWVYRLRNQFIRGEIVDDGGKPARGGRRNENFTYEQEAELLKPFLKEASIGGILVAGETSQSSKPRGVERWVYLRYTNSCIGITGASLPPINSIRKATQLRRKRLKKLPETLAEIRKDWTEGKPIRLMFQDEARFGRINDVRRCWAPKPMRPLCHRPC